MIKKESLNVFVCHNCEKVHISVNGLQANLDLASFIKLYQKMGVLVSMVTRDPDQRSIAETSRRKMH